MTAPPRPRSAPKCARGSATISPATSPRWGRAAAPPTRRAGTCASSGSGCSDATAGWACHGRVEYGGRGAGVAQQIVFNEEYARANAPARISFFGEGLFAPTLIQFGTDEQKQRFLPKIQAVEELWCQGFSEPNAGSDLANVQTRAVLDGDEWVITGQKVWTTLAHRADWCFVVCRTDPESTSHHGLSYLLCPMHQDGVEVRPLRQLTGSSEFNEVFFDGARTAKENVLGPVGEGWKVAMATLGFERGTAFLSQQLAFEHELAHLIDVARKNGARDDVAVRDELADSYAALASDALQRATHAHEPRAAGQPGSGSERRQTVLDDMAPRLRRDRHEGARHRRAPDPRRPQRHV